jgi:uncharacterized protein (DUF2164 family)
MTTEKTFKFPKEQLEELRAVIKGYFLDELEMEIGDLQADLFIEFLNEHVGKQYYNLGVTDAIAAIKDKTDDLVLLIKD